MARDCDCFWIMVEELGAVRAIETHHSICGHQDKEAGELGVRDVGAAPMTSELDRSASVNRGRSCSTNRDRAVGSDDMWWTSVLPACSSS